MAQRKGFFSRLAGMNPLSEDNPFRHMGAAMADIYGQMRGKGPRRLDTPVKGRPRKGTGAPVQQYPGVLRPGGDARWQKETGNMQKARRNFSKEEQDQMGLNG